MMMTWLARGAACKSTFKPGCRSQAKDVRPSWRRVVLIVKHLIGCPSAHADMSETFTLSASAFGEYAQYAGAQWRTLLEEAR